MHFPSILVAVAIQALLVLSQPAAPTATVDSGVIIGTTTSLPGSAETVHKYLGVPFASSPPQRFRPPQKPQTWNTSLEATVIKPACLQLFSGCKLYLQSTMHLLHGNDTMQTRLN